MARSDPIGLTARFGFCSQKSDQQSLAVRFGVPRNAVSKGHVGWQRVTARHVDQNVCFSASVAPRSGAKTCRGDG